MIRVLFEDGTTADLPPETPTKVPFARTAKHELWWARAEGYMAVRVERDGLWTRVQIETWEDEAERLRASESTVNEAWARYLSATEDLFLQVCGGPAERDLAPEREKREAARLALLALGVDAKALMAEVSK